MATKAELFKAQSQRTKPQPPKAKKPRRNIDPHNTATRNLTKRADKGTTVALEESLSGKPSRKSTRSAIHGGRNDQQLQRIARGMTLIPKAVALRGHVARKK